MSFRIVPEIENFEEVDEIDEAEEVGGGHGNGDEVIVAINEDKEEKIMVKSILNLEGKKHRVKLPEQDQEEQFINQLDYATISEI
jgi:hypothetical protein